MHLTHGPRTKDKEFPIEKVEGKNEKNEVIGV